VLYFRFRIESRDHHNGGFLIPNTHMNILQHTTYITPVTRRFIAVLALIVAMTSIRVQSAQAQEVLPDLPNWLVTAGDDADSKENRGIEVKQRAPASLKNAADKPVKKWNTINSADLETKPGHSSEPAVRTFVVATSAYTSDPNETDSSPFTTANGTRVRDGIVAANFLKFGTRIRIPDYFGDKVFEVHDRMNARYTQRVDIWMLGKAEAFSWGVRNVKIEVLD
jgi:3D (Asp-Asp-Asp) domain-containing protein